MDIQTITLFINQVGFPVAVCCVLIWQSIVQNKTITTLLVKNEIALTNLTTAVQCLCDEHDRNIVLHDIAASTHDANLVVHDANLVKQDANLTAVSK
jgi:hypothetical protein